MSVQCSWLIEDRVLFNQYNGEVTLSDLDAAAAHNVKAMAASDRVLPLMVDFRQATKYPLNASAILSSVKRGLRHPNAGPLATISQNNRVIDLLSTLVLRMSGIEHGIFSDFESAYAYIRQHAPSLPEYVETV